MVKKETTIPTLLNIILENVEDVMNFVEGMSLEDFLDDKKTLRACERGIEIIGDACKEVLNRAEAEHFALESETVKLFKAVYGTRNFLSHGYDSPDFRLLYNILLNDLPDFKPVVMRLQKGYES